MFNKVKRSIANKLLRIVFAIYIVIAIVFALIQVVFEYRYQKEAISIDLIDLQHGFEDALASAIWNLDQEAFHSTIAGLIEIPIIVGVKVKDNEGRYLVLSGLITRDNLKLGYDQYIDVYGIDSDEIEEEKVLVVPDIFEHSYPITYDNESEKRILGYATFYSNSKVIFRRVKFGYLVNFIITIAKIVLLWIIFMLIFTKLLKKPLVELASSAKDITLDNLHSYRINGETYGENELKVLQDSFNSMIITLYESIRNQNTVEKEIVRLRNLLSNIIDSMASIIICVDKDCKVTVWNHAAEKETGIKASKARTKYLKDVYSVQDSDIVHIIESMNNNEIYNENNRFSDDNGNKKYTNMTIFPLADSRNIGAVVRIDDVTKEYQLTEQLTHSRKMKAIGQLAGGVAHDFNNMLTGIMHSAEILKMNGLENSKENILYVDMILDCAARSANLTNQLLAFGRKRYNERKMVDIDVLINHTLAIMRSTLDKRINIQYQNNSTNNFTLGDEMALQNVLINILINASYAMNNEGIIKIYVNSKFIDEYSSLANKFALRTGNYLEISIEDFGCGISDNNLNKIFEPFYTTKEVGQGTGLGLAAAFGTLQDHQGAIEVESELDIGTTFYIYLPTKKD